MIISRTFDCDVLIIGAGGAALRSAYESAKRHTTVIVIEKGVAGNSGATVSQNSQSLAWQMADECSLDDSPKEHARNIVDIGLGVANKHLASLLAEEVVDVSMELQQLGMCFIPDPAGIKPHYSGYSCFGNRARAHGLMNEGFGHGGNVVQTLLKHLDFDYAQIHNKVFGCDLLVRDGVCYGALALADDDQWILYKARATIVATGGAWQIFPPELGKELINTSGDGYAMGYRGGADLANMEFMQYMLHRVKPFGVEVPGVYWALEPNVVNRYGESVLEHYLPSGVTISEVMQQRTEHYPFSTRDDSRWLDIAIASEIAKGNGDSDGTLWLDFTKCDLNNYSPSRPQHIPEDFLKPPVITGNGIEKVRISAHAINGGLLTDEWARTSIQGLYAVGEVATGAHGADRLGGGMVSAGQVFGKRAAIAAVAYAKEAYSHIRSYDEVNERIARFGKSGKYVDHATLFNRFQNMMSNHFSLIRNEKAMIHLVGELETFQKKDLDYLPFNDSRQQRSTLELANLIETALLMVNAALYRKESRGGHYRSDYPYTDFEHWSSKIIINRKGNVLQSEQITQGGN